LAALALGILAAPAFADAPLTPGYKFDERLQLLFYEYRVSGPTVEKPGAGGTLVCTYSTRPVAMIYARELNAPVIRLIKELDEAVQTHKKERLGAYVVLLCDKQESEKDLAALAKKEKLRHVLLSLVVLDAPARQRFDAKFGKDAETTV